MKLNELLEYLNQNNVQYKVTKSEYNHDLYTVLIPLSNGKYKEMVFLFKKLVFLS